MERGFRRRGGDGGPHHARTRSRPSWTAGPTWSSCPPARAPRWCGSSGPSCSRSSATPTTAERARRVGERTRELTELLAERAEALPDLRLWNPRRVTLHQSCHLLRELHVVDQPAELLARVEGCELVEWSGSDRCCGFGGTFSVKLPEASVAMADEKLRAVGAVGADVVVGCDTSCLLHMRTRSEAVGTPIEIRHVAQVLHEALPAGAGRRT